MEKNATIVVTGAAGFIGSCLAGYLNERGFKNLILVDDFSRADKVPNLSNKNFNVKIDRQNFFEWYYSNKPGLDFIFHIGARTDTTEFNYAVHQKLNLEYSKNIWHHSTVHNIPLVYASSAATYGSGDLGYNDDHKVIFNLRPLNPYGVSKNEFDKWVLHQGDHPPFWAGLKFFNVYGPNEYHKGRMASVVYHSFKQLQNEGLVKLFKSFSQEFKDGEQLRDFIYIKDILKVCFWMMENPPASGIYNVGTGIARSFNDLVKATFAGMAMEPKIVYVDMPEDIRDTYQYYTQANMNKLKNAGYNEDFFSLENGIGDYVKNYLALNKYY